jgi:H+/Cl- antiporter ClcA
MHFRHIYGIETLWILLFSLGIFTSLLAWGMDEVVAVLLIWKQTILLSGEVYQKLAIWLLIAIVFTFSAAILVRLVSPFSAGSGIPGKLIFLSYVE